MSNRLLEANPGSCNNMAWLQCAFFPRKATAFNLSPTPHLRQLKVVSVMYSPQLVRRDSVALRRLYQGILLLTWWGTCQLMSWVRKSTLRGGGGKRSFEGFALDDAGPMVHSWPDEVVSSAKQQQPQQPRRTHHPG